MNPLLQALQHGLKALFVPVLLRIQSGPFQGRMWIAASGPQFIRCTCEPDISRWFASSVRGGQVDKTRNLHLLDNLSGQCEATGIERVYLDLWHTGVKA